MSSAPRRFETSELLGLDGLEFSDVDLAEALAAARVVEAGTGSDVVRVSSGFEDRVMAAIAREPAPRRARSGGLLAAIGEAWRLATEGGRPIAVRAQALAFVLLVAFASISLGGLAAVGVGAFLGAPSTPPELVSPAPSVVPSQSPRPSPTPSAVPSPSPTPSPSPSPRATESLEPSPSPDATEPADDNSGPGGHDNSGPGGVSSGPGGTSEPD